MRCFAASNPGRPAAKFGKRSPALASDPGVLAEVRNEIGVGQRVPIDETPTIVVIRGSRSIPISGRLIKYELLKQLLDDLAKR
jgi:hypothetical protein